MSGDRAVVISQPMLFPWVGMFEQIRLANVFVYYDDVQFSKGSFTNRVQLKGEKGSEWMSIPLEKFHLGQNINEIAVSGNTDWKKKHLSQLVSCYEQAEFFEEMMALVESVYSPKASSLSEISMTSMKVVCDYFDLTQQRTFCMSSENRLEGRSSERVLDYALYFHCSRYVTGHGAMNYLNHELFDTKGVSVEYMDYKKIAYPQLFGEFTPFVSILDLVANCGERGREYICSGTIGWGEMLAGVEGSYD